jgi:hypothetical protein
MTRLFRRTLFVVVLASAAAGAQTQRRPQQQPPPGRARPAAGADAAGAQARRGINPQAEQIMRRMSEYMAGLQSFRVRNTSVDEVVLGSGQKVQQVAETRLSVQRPNHIRADRVGPVANMSFTYDGQNFNLVGNRTGYYTTTPAPPTLDAAVDTLRDRFGMDIPAADLFVSRPYDTMMEGVRTGTYVGLEPIGGVPTHHLAFTADDVDWQIWVQDGAQPLPRRLVITSKRMRSAPEFTAELSDWEPNARLDADVFALRPPPNGRRIELLPAAARAAHERQGR